MPGSILCKLGAETRCRVSLSPERRWDRPTMRSSGFAVDTPRLDSVDSASNGCQAFGFTHLSSSASASFGEF
jgi:hypothetical protein